MDVLFGLAVLPAFLLMIYIRKKDKIEKNLERVDKYINKYFKNDKNYYHCFILIIYNLKRYLINKEARNRNKKEKKEEIEENEE